MTALTTAGTVEPASGNRGAVAPADRDTRPAVARYAGAGGRKSVTLALDVRPYVGGVWEVRYRIEAARVARNGTVASSDVVPNKGTAVYYGNGLGVRIRRRVRPRFAPAIS